MNVVRLSRKDLLRLSEDGAEIEFLRRDEVTRRWAIKDIVRVFAVPSKSFTTSAYFQLIRRGQPQIVATHWESSSHADVIVVIDSSKVPEVRALIQTAVSSHGIQIEDISDPKQTAHEQAAHFIASPPDIEPSTGPVLLDRKQLLQVSEDGAEIEFLRRDEVTRRWAIKDIVRVFAVPSKSFTTSAYFQLIRRGQPQIVATHWESSSHADVIVVIDSSKVPEVRALIQTAVSSHGIQIEDNSDPKQTAHEQTLKMHLEPLSIKLGSGEFIKWTGAEFILPDEQTTIRIDDVENGRLRIRRFAGSFIQVIPKGTELGWPRGRDVSNHPFTWSLDGVNRENTLAADRLFGALSSARPTQFQLLKKEDDRVSAEIQLYRKTEKRLGKIVSTSDGTSIHVYKSQIWNGPPFDFSSVGGSIEGVHAAYTVSGNHVDVPYTINQTFGSTRVHEVHDMRVFLISVNGPHVSFSYSWPAEEGATDLAVDQLVNTINKTAREFDSIHTRELPFRSESRASGVSVQSRRDRLIDLFASGSITKEEFHKATSDLPPAD